jgi:lysozyme family protein
MRDNLEIAVSWMLAHEGGYVNHPKDPGGATNMGVTQRVYDSYRRKQRQAERSVRAITSDEVADIYKAQYWDAVKADDLPSGVDYAVFDYGVNSGTKRAIMELQRVVGATVDGILGLQTLAKTQEMDAFEIIEQLCRRRMAFLRGLKHWKTFGNGWTARVMGIKDGFQADDIGVIDRAMMLARNDKATATELPMPISVGTGKAVEADRENIAQSSTMQALLVQGGSLGGTAIAAVQGLEGRNQTIVIVLVGIAALALLWIAKERIRKWADGDR